MFTKNKISAESVISKSESIIDVFSKTATDLLNVNTEIANCRDTITEERKALQEKEKNLEAQLSRNIRIMDKINSFINS